MNRTALYRTELLGLYISYTRSAKGRNMVIFGYPLIVTFGRLNLLSLSPTLRFLVVAYLGWVVMFWSFYYLLYINSIITTRLMKCFSALSGIYYVLQVSRVFGQSGMYPLPVAPANVLEANH